MKDLLLAIESSCDDSSIAVINIQNLECLFHEKISQEQDHEGFGGVVPELAARLHAKALPKILEKCKPYFPYLAAVAATCSPGLSVSLLGGISMAKTLAMLLKVPLIGVNHLEGHIYSLFLDSEADFKGLGVLLVSGGHTLVADMDAGGVILSRSLDDSFGESFDKVSRMLGMGYPGGERVQNLALKARSKTLRFTLPMTRNKSYDYSFSGLKNQVRLEVLKKNHEKAELAYAFEEAATEHILYKLKRLFKQKSFKSFGVVGGAAANLKLRLKLGKLCEENDCKLILAPLKYCSDNAVMIARCARQQYLQGDFASFKDELLFAKDFGISLKS